jgi:hypothetical protein
MDQQILQIILNYREDWGRMGRDLRIRFDWSVLS